MNEHDKLFLQSQIDYLKKTIEYHRKMLAEKEKELRVTPTNTTPNKSEATVAYEN